MASIWDPGMRDRLVGRVTTLRPDAERRWGSMTCPQMLAHLNDALRMAAGDLHVPSKRLPIRHPPLKQLIVYVLPFPKGAPTAPELIAREPANWEAEQRDFTTLLDRVIARRGSGAWPEHPAFGVMTERAWGVLVYRHTHHHLDQFGA